MARQTVASNGNCFICGKNSAKTQMKNHVIKEHNTGDEKCYLIKAEGAYNKNYWLLFSVHLTAKLESVDEFLRDIWCECCGHLSGFSIDREEVEMSMKISALRIGDKLLYEYDYGSTTGISVTIVSELSREKSSSKVQLLARNESPSHFCVNCSLPAVNVDTWDHTFFCEDCSGEDNDDVSLLPVVNSPRMGVCGYTGDNDVW